MIPTIVDPDSLATAAELRLALHAANRQLATQTLKLAAQTIAMQELARQTGTLVAMIETGKPSLITPALQRFRRYINTHSTPIRKH